MSRYLILAIETIDGISRKDTMTNNDYDISATLKKTIIMIVILVEVLVLKRMLVGNNFFYDNNIYNNTSNELW